MQALLNQADGSAVTLSFDATQGTAIGAKVTALVGGKQLVREVRSVNGAVQAEPVAYFGLGDASAVESVEVRWPDGTVQQLGTLDAGQHRVTKP